MRICNVKDCNNKHRWHGYCVNHARAFDKYGDPLAKHKRFHGGTGTPEYEVWRGMKQRCYLKSSPYYSFLGRWVHISAQLDMSAFTATTTTSYMSKEP